MKRLFLVSTMALAVPVAAAQPTEVQSYLPLAIGNTWSYYETIEPPDAPPDTIWTGTYTISESITVNDTLYYLYSFPFALADTLRSDEQGRVWARVEGKDVLLFDFALEEEQTYTYEDRRVQDGEPGLQYTVTVRRNQTVQVHAGRFEDCIELLFDNPDWVDEERAYRFAPGVGLVSARAQMGATRQLHSAEVDGEVITSVEGAQELPAAFVLESAYPNPFNPSTTIAFALSQPSRVRIAVYDVAGREVATLADGIYGAQRHLVRWNATGRASGVYYAVVHVGASSRIIGLFLTR